MGRKKNNGKYYEGVVHGLYQHIEENALIKLNDKIFGRNSQINREIDISIRSNVAGHEILIIVQVKDHKVPADVKIIGEFSSVITDVGASKGVIFCSSGFSKAAIELGKNLKIDLFSVHDKATTEKAVNYQFPVIKESIQVRLKNFTFHISEIVDGKLVDDVRWGQDEFQKILHLPIDTDKFGNTSFLKQFYAKWDSNEFPINEQISINLEGGVLHDGDRLFQISVSEFTFVIKRLFCLKYLNLLECKSLYNHIKGVEKEIVKFSDLTFPIGYDDEWKLIEAPKTIEFIQPTAHLEVFYFYFQIYKRLNITKDFDSKDIKNFQNEQLISNWDWDMIKD